MKCHRLAFQWSPLAMGLALIIALPGCGGSSGKKLSTVKGTISYKGQPLSNGSVSFVPITKGTTSTGEIDNGQYQLSTYQKNDGVPPGDYKVAVIAWEKAPEMTTEGKAAIPKKYFDPEKSGLTAKVADGTQKIDFELKD